MQMRVRTEMCTLNHAIRLAQSCTFNGNEHLLSAEPSAVKDGAAERKHSLPLMALTAKALLSATGPTFLPSCEP
eukprot:1162062-Pelagomonas_calceolata.AAC.6